MEETTVSESGPAQSDPETQQASDISEDRRMRADTYSILASLLSTTPTSDLIDYLRHIDSSAETEPDTVGDAWQRLHKAAESASDPAILDSEFHKLFIGLGRGEIVPFGSWHLTGFLMEKPLSELRDDLKSLGIESAENEKDPEDHIAALCETMAILIDADDVDEIRERNFFRNHIHPWADKFFQELQQSQSADFYRHVGYLGEKFIQLENQYLNIQTH